MKDVQILKTKLLEPSSVCIVNVYLLFSSGTFEKGIIEVTHSFPVPHKVFKGEVSIRLNYAHTMLKLERKVI